MNPRRLLAIARKEGLHVIRDGRSLAMAIAIPMLMLFLFGYALTLDVDRVPLAVWDRSDTPASREFVSRFGGSRYFTLQSYVTDYAAVERAIDSRLAAAALVVPEDFGRAIDAGRRATVQFIVDGSDSNTATIVIGYADFVVTRYSLDVTLDSIARAGGVRLATPVDLRPRVWFNEDLSSRNYIVPGLIAVIMMVIAALLTSLTVAREWERGTMEQLVSTPIRPAELIIGKLLPYFVIGMVDVALCILMGEFVYDVPLRGSVVLLFVMASVFLAGALSLGLFISVITRSQLVANQFAMVLTFLPAFLLSGFVYPIANMPLAIRLVTYVIPARYFVALLKGIYLKGVGLEILAGEAVLLVVFASSMVALSIVGFRRKLA
jgi:ABC-2 type transport system permease protein